ncbi:MAG TPA: ABC transporter ATP-binding protein, partial [Acidimicrobiaceae bacterium]|nr:ABC transporter ATP-binding protein [Acidimicrobiaceae bacterium]
MSPPPGTELPTLALEGVDVRLSGRQVLRDVSFSLGPGSVTGLIGPNG